MSDRYMIRNCNVIYFNLDKTAICNDLNLECPCYCKERTDCVLKQIVKKCRKSLEVSYCPIEQEILQLLDIQECE